MTTKPSAWCREIPRIAILALTLCGMNCMESRDLGSTIPRGLLPVDARNPIVIVNDGAYDNWQGEYAVLLANGGGLRLEGIVVNASGAWTDINANMTGWRGLVAAARTSGMTAVPDPIASIGTALRRPSDGQFRSTTPNRSEGALLILDLAARLSLPYRPLVVVTGGRLTDLGDAYLMDPTITERVVVVSALGVTTSAGGAMVAPNGEMDPWADAIVAARFRYVQVSAFYDQLSDVPTARLPDLPANAFGAWIAAKQPNVWSLTVAADQVALLAVALPTFATAIQHVSVATSVGAGANSGPELVVDPAGPNWLVTQSAGDAATERFWQLLMTSSAP